MSARVAVWLLFVAGCEGSIVGGLVDLPPDDEVLGEDIEGTPTSSIDPPQYVQARCEGAPPTRSYRGFGGERLEDDRRDLARGLDSRRTTLFERGDSAGGHLDTVASVFEFSKGFVTPQSASAYGFRERGWFADPTGSALLLATQYRLAYLSCQRLLEQKRGWASHVEFAVTPTEASARSQCRALSTRFWNVKPTDTQLDECVTYATVETASETVPARRWAYVCATLISTTYALTH